MLQLLNHTAGWSGDVFDNTGDGDDALARYVELMADVEQVTPLGATVSYNNASLSVAGRIIEKVTGQTYEQAIKELLFEPLGLDHSWFFPNEIMTRRFAVGHNQHADGSITVARPWAMARSGNPAGGISSNAGDQITWARFHLGDGTGGGRHRGAAGEAAASRCRSRRSTCPGARSATPSGSAGCCATSTACASSATAATPIGQHSTFVMVPEREFAIIALTNCGPNGPQLQRRAGAVGARGTTSASSNATPSRSRSATSELAEYVGHVRDRRRHRDITRDDDSGGLVVKAEIKPEMLARWTKRARRCRSSRRSRSACSPATATATSSPTGPAKGMKGYFVRDAAGAIEGVHVGGRLATKVSGSTDGTR